MSTPQGAFHVDLASNFGMELTSTEGYEPATTEMLQSVVKPGDTFIDLGANEGYFSVIGAKIVGGAGRVYTIEPQIRLHPVILKNMECNGSANFQLIAAAVSDTDGVGALWLAPDMNTGSSGLFRATRYNTPKQQVRLCRLATLLAECELDAVDVIKMDIEGFEYEVILGSREVFVARRVRCLIVEIHSELLRRRDKNPIEISDFLTSCGYTFRTDCGWTVFELPAVA